MFIYLIYSLLVALAASYSFNAKSSTNLAVYFGATRASTNTTLFAQCNDTNVDIAVLGFLTNIFDGGGYPDIGFTDLCSGQTAEMVAANATGLMNCSSLALQISQCHDLGKKVLISIGGSLGNATFSSVANAQEGARLLWDTFGGGSGVDAGLRPFGEVEVDGFDIGRMLSFGLFPYFALLIYI
jgi:chitinase